MTLPPLSVRNAVPSTSIAPPLAGSSGMSPEWVAVIRNSIAIRSFSRISWESSIRTSGASARHDSMLSFTMAGPPCSELNERPLV